MNIKNKTIRNRQVKVFVRHIPSWLLIANLIVWAIDLGIILQKFLLPIFISYE